MKPMKNQEKAPVRKARLEARVTEEEYGQAMAAADACGLSLSDYVRKCTLGHRPKLRLTEREAETLCSLSDARGDLVRIAAAVKSIQNDKRGLYFHNTQFVEQWMRAAVPLIERWGEIKDSLML